MSDDPITILVVDDSALYRQLIQNVLREIPAARSVGTAKDGHDALQKIEKLRPDLLTLDVQMPDMDGIGVLQAIKSKKLATKAIMVSSFTSQGAEVTTEALLEGAFDFILKPSQGNAASNREQLSDELSEKITLFRESIQRRSRRSSQQATADSTASASNANMATPAAECRAAILGASTGGPAALKRVLPRLPSSLPVGLLIVQHMPPRYTKSLANRLNAISEIEILEGEDGMPVQAGRAIIAPGGSQMGVRNEKGQTVVEVSDAPSENGVRPSLDYLVRSATDVFNGQLLTIVMTGMGRDGLAGCRTLKGMGGAVFAQSEEDCVVFGMPKAIIDENLADRILPLARIAPAIVRHLKRSRGS